VKKRIALFFACLICFACLFGGAAFAAEKPDTVVLASQQDFAVLDPFFTTATPVLTPYL